MIPQALLDVAEFISESIRDDHIQLLSGDWDARQDSSVAEKTIVDYLQKQARWKILSPNSESGHNRNWYDLQVEDYYCDIKVSKLKTQDNAQAKKAIYYLLTGQDPDRVSSQNEPFFRAMSKMEDPNEERDFYYIVVNKLEADAFIVSLKGIGDIHPAHNNPPFQCRWGDCRKPVDRTWIQAREHLLGCWAKSTEKGIATLKSGMPTFYPEFFRK